MNYYKYYIIFLILFQFSCDEQSTPFSPTLSSHNYEFNLEGRVRDFVILEDVDAESFLSEYNGFETIMIGCNQTLNASDCNNRYWCEWEDSGACVTSPKDLLLVANEEVDKGLLIYEILDKQGQFFSLVYSNNSFEEVSAAPGQENIEDLELRSIYYDEDNYTIYVLDKFEYVYTIFLPGILDDFIPPATLQDTEKNNNVCDDLDNNSSDSIAKLAIEANSGHYHSTKFRFKKPDVYSNSYGVFVLHKNNQSTNSDLTPASTIYLSDYALSTPLFQSCDAEGDHIVLPNSLSPNVNDLELDYNTTDILYDSDVLIAANPTDSYFSLKMFDMQDLTQSAEILTPSKVYSLSSKDDYLLYGLKDNGCYITLLPTHSNFVANNPIFHIGDSFTVYDIYYDGSTILLSCGSNGVLIYNWIAGQTVEPFFVGYITSSYAYTAIKYGSSTIMIGTKNGIEVYNIGI